MPNQQQARRRTDNAWQQALARVTGRPLGNAARSPMAVAAGWQMAAS